MHTGTTTFFFWGKTHTTNCGLPQCIKREVEYYTKQDTLAKEIKTTGKPYRNTRRRCALLLLNYGQLTEVNKDNIKMKGRDINHHHLTHQRKFIIGSRGIWISEKKNKNASKVINYRINAIRISSTYNINYLNN